MRFLVLGCGSIGQRHVKNLLAADAGPVLAYDVADERRRMAERETGVATVESLAAAWEWGPTVAFVATSTDSHVPLALEVARRGCHLFVEKPLSHDTAGAQSLVEEAAERRLVTMVACNMRFHPGPATVKRLLDEGAVGEVLGARIQSGSYLPRWRPWQDYRQSYSASPTSGGAILDCIHELDLALWLLGPARLAAALTVPATSIGLAVDGMAEVLLRHESGAISNVHLSFVQRDYRRTSQIIGAAGTVYWDWSEAAVRVYGEDGELQRTIPQPEGWQVNEMYAKQLDHFLAAVRSGRETMNPLSSGLATLEVALSARVGGDRP